MSKYIVTVSITLEAPTAQAAEDRVRLDLGLPIGGPAPGAISVTRSGLGDAMSLADCKAYNARRFRVVR